MLAVVLLAAVYVLFAGTDVGRQIDAVLADRDLEPRLTGVWLLAGALVVVLLSPIAVCVAVLGLWWRAGRLGRPDDGIRAALIVGAAAFGARALKRLLEALDPVGGDAARQLGSAFYPSGHAAAAMALCLAAMVVLRGRRAPLLLAGGVWCSVQGFAIFASRSHHLSDVLGGFLLGFAVAAAIGLRACSSIRLAAPVRCTSALLMVAGVLATVMVAELARRAALSSLPPHAVLVTAGAGLCAAAFAIVATFVRLLGATRAAAPDQA